MLTFFKTFTRKQADIMSKFVGVVSGRHVENINKISSDVNKKFGKLQKEMSKSGSATISIKLNKCNKEGGTIISDNPNKEY